MEFVPWKDAQTGQRKAVVKLLVTGFDKGPRTGWPTEAEAELELAEFDSDERVGFLGIVDGGVAGFVGAIVESKTLWELHPLVVDTHFRGRGCGRMLVERIEEAAWEAGVLTIFLGTDDDTDCTNASGIDLYGDIPGAITRLEARRPHPFTFYQHLGYTVVGLLPDATGPGKPDILMAKRLDVESETE